MEEQTAARVLGAIQDDAKLREHFTERFYVPHLTGEMMEVAKQAVDAGELPLQNQLAPVRGYAVWNVLSAHAACGASRFAGRTRRRRLISPLQGRKATGVSFARNSKKVGSPLSA